MTSLHTLTATTPGLPCRTTDPEIFFSKSSTEREHAKGLCQECPIRTACAQYALDNPELKGVWGGTTAADRRSFHDGRPWRFDDAGRLRLECGSEEAYRAHFGYRETPCDECKAAHEEHITTQRRARLDEEHAKGCSSTGFWLHRRLGEPPCAGCRGALQAQQAIAREARARRGRGLARAASTMSGAADRLRGAPAGAQPLPLAV
ncbi:WhiB family transcriptional regulator [Streptomyces acidicola]|uniref:WhiB family transcriptional regulator n=1 Tax=Streptomyces acidicola TaxID=2596892 RepID=UPI00378EFDCB